MVQDWIILEISETISCVCFCFFVLQDSGFPDSCCSYLNKIWSGEIVLIKLKVKKLQQCIIKAALLWQEGLKEGEDKNSTDMLPALWSVVCGGITQLCFVLFLRLLKFSYSKKYRLSFRTHKIVSFLLRGQFWMKELNELTI